MDPAVTQDGRSQNRTGMPYTSLTALGSPREASMTRMSDVCQEHLGPLGLLASTGPLELPARLARWELMAPPGPPARQVRPSTP